MVSLTLMVWLTVSDTLPQASVAHHLRVEVIEQPAPLVIVVESNVTVEQLSLAVGAWKVGVVPQVIVVLAPCPLTVGRILSVIVIVWLTVSERLPQASVAHHIRVVVIEHPVPLFTVLESIVTIEQLSLAVGAWNTIVPLQAIVLFGP